MNVRTTQIFFLLLIYTASVLSLSSCKSNKEDASAKKGDRPKGLFAEGYLVKMESFQNDFDASGTLLPNESVEIHPEISGRITSISFKEGANVRKGQMLLQLSDADILAQIQKLRAQRALQQKMLERQQELLRIGGISRQDYETTQTQISSINADIAFQEAQLRKTRILAPFDGRIGLRSVSVGAIVTTTTVVATLQQLSQLKMDFSVPDQYRTSVAPGKVVFFTIPGSTESFSGKITASDPGADVGTRSIKVRATVANPNGNLTSGAFAHVKVPFESHNNSILIPTQSIIPTTRDKKVAIVRKGKAELVVIQLGSRTEDKVEVIQGLVPGDTVITTGLMQLKPGMEVKITKLKT